MELDKKDWPTRINNVKPKVKDLFFKGDIDLLLNDSPKLAIVGSRRMTDYGKRLIEKWMPELVSRGVVIVSGFMYGVDQEAHKQCLDNGGKTIAVLGWGIDRKVSADDEKLYQKILEVDSLIVSEYPEKMEATRGTFPARNRIVAGIADAVLVIEAADKSGSMITARLAKKFGKSLLAVPGRIGDRVSEGTNCLIKEGVAVMVTEVGEVLQTMNLGIGQLKLIDNAVIQDPIVESLLDGEKTLDELVVLLRIPVNILAAKLSLLCVQGVVTERNGKYCV